MRNPALLALSRRLLSGIALLAFAIRPAAAQPGPPEIGPVSGEIVQDGTPRVFLDCSACDQVFLRREIPFVNYVRDRLEADIHLLITVRQTGSGGLSYTLSFIGLRAFTGLDQQLVHASPQGSTEDEVRQGLAQIIKLGLIPYVAQTPMASQVAVSFRNTDVQVVEVRDRWNSWIFDIGADGSFSGEASRSAFSVRGDVSADRITETWKIRMRAYANYSERRFQPPDTLSSVIVSTSESNGAQANLVRSLGDHWSGGLFGNVYASTYNNIDLGLSVAPALEYSLFPYQESTRREFVVVYRAGLRSVDYIEETIFGKTGETLFDESLEMALRVTQPWGSIFSRLQGSHYFHDFSKNRIEFYSNLSLRVVKGLSVRISGGVEVIHDQLYLPKGDVTQEELLLQRRQLATTYEYSGSIGLSYTFGSIYNNVVNTRL